jgi:hypothetical protein
MLGRVVTAAASIAVAVIALSACAAEAPVSPEAPVPSASATVEPVEPCPVDDPVAWGDVIARETVAGAAGSYCAVTPSPDAAAMRLDPALVNAGALSQWGFSDAQTLAAQQAAVRFVVEVALDSPFLDPTDGVPAEGSIAHWLGSTPYTFAEFSPADSVVLNGRLPPLARDGGPRASSTTVEIVRITAQGGKSGPTAILVQLEASSLFRPADSAEEIPVETTYTIGTDASGAIVSLGYGFEVGAVVD